MHITMIGSGNVATHMAAAFKNAGHKILQVYSRDIRHASMLAYHVGADAIDNIDQLSNDTDIFIIAIRDDVIAEFAGKLSKYKKLIAHTSGSVSLQALLNYTEKAGVFYPLQTFSKSMQVNFLEVPLCIEGADEANTNILKELAQTISNKVYSVNSSQRKTIHLSAVFACNFTNYMYSIAEQLLEENNIDFDIIRPLILETADKIKNNLPADVQTGPAIRSDEKTMELQLQELKNYPDLQQLYMLVSQGIIKMDNEHIAGR